MPENYEKKKQESYITRYWLIVWEKQIGVTFYVHWTAKKEKGAIAGGDLEKQCSHTLLMEM